VPNVDGDEMMLHPLGIGAAKKIRVSGFTIAAAGLLPDGKGVWFDGNEPSQGRKLYLTSVDGATPRPIVHEPAVLLPPHVADGKHLVAMIAGKAMLIPLDGSQPQPLRGVEFGERVTGWSADSPSFFVFRRSDLLLKVYRVEKSTGRRSCFKEIGPRERAGIGTTGLHMLMPPNGKSYLYVPRWTLGELYAVKGLK
jgi:hypothetical protein